MSKLKDKLIARKVQIEKQLEPYYELKNELEEIRKALLALEPKRCKSGCPGCSICRGGLEYR